MRRELLIYGHFLVALSGAWLAAQPGSDLFWFAATLPGGDWVDISDIREGIVISGVPAMLIFWIIGRWSPLRASLLRTVVAGTAAAALFFAAAVLAAQVEWLTGNFLLAATPLILASLGYLPFRFCKEHQTALGACRMT